MARVSLTTQKITRAGLNLTAALAGPPTVDGDVFDAGAVALYVDNGSGGSINVTFRTPTVIDGLDLEELIVAVPAGESRLVGPFPKRTFGQLAGAVESGGNDAGRVYVDYSAQTSVTRAAVSF